MQITGSLILKGVGSVGAVWLSGLSFARDIKILRKHKIMSILTMTEVPIKFPPEFNQKLLRIDDEVDAKIKDIFPESFNFIDEQRARTNVLVHCSYGISRGPSILIAYIMKKQGLSFDEAYNMVKSIRPIIMPNQGFQISLRQASEEFKQTK